MDIYKAMCSVQSSLLFLYYVVFSVMSVGFSVHMFSVSLLSVGSVLMIAFNASSAQHQFSFLSSLHGRVCSIHSQWCSVLSGLQSTVVMVCRLLFSVGSVQSSIQLSVGFRVYSVQCL